MTEQEIVIPKLSLNRTPMCPLTRKPCIPECKWRRGEDCAVLDLLMQICTQLSNIDTSIQLLAGR